MSFPCSFHPISMTLFSVSGIYIAGWIFRICPYTQSLVIPAKTIQSLNFWPGLEGLTPHIKMGKMTSKRKKVKYKKITLATSLAGSQYKKFASFYNDPSSFFSLQRFLGPSHMSFVPHLPHSSPILSPDRSKLTCVQDHKAP